MIAWEVTVGIPIQWDNARFRDELSSMPSLAERRTSKLFSTRCGHLPSLERTWWATRLRAGRAGSNMVVAATNIFAARGPLRSNARCGCTPFISVHLRSTFSSATTFSSGFIDFPSKFSVMYLHYPSLFLASFKHIPAALGIATMSCSRQVPDVLERGVASGRSEFPGQSGGRTSSWRWPFPSRNPTYW